MASELAERARDAFIDGDLKLAVSLYSESADLDPRNADLFVERAQAYIKLGNFCGMSSVAKVHYSCCLVSQWQAV